MCGIAGQVAASGLDRGDARRQLETMVEAMRHRGPDDTGVFASNAAAIGMCRLSIIDVAGGHQPISTPDGRYHIVYNGECYGVGALRAELASRGHRFATRTDTEVALYTYVEHGPEGLHRLNGMFGLAIWDAVERELFLARDRLGIKPLFYWQDGDSLVFSSTLSAIQARRDFCGDIDPRGLELYLSTKFVPGPYTILRQVKKLMPGHWARWRDGRLDIKRWWDVPLPRGGAPAISPGDAEAEALRLLTDAARLRLVSERPVGICLSGGIDSGLIASVVADEQTQTYSLGFDDADFDESKVAATVARQLGIPHTILIGTMDAERDFPAVIESYDEPVADSSGVALYTLSRLMSQHVTVVLSGTGGDELFGGYLRYVGSRLARIVQHIPGLALLPRLLGRDESKLGWRGQIARFSWTGAAPPLDSFQRFLSPATPRLAAELRRPSFVDSLDGFRTSTVFRQHFDRAEGASLLSRLMYTDIKTVMVDDYLVKEDRMTMAHSLEGRVPFLDHRLVELAYSLPDHHKIRGLTTKRLLRRLAAKRLPRPVASAPKQGFEIPQVSWLRGPLRQRLEDTLLSPKAILYEHLEPSVAHRLVREHVANEANHSRPLWTLLTLETWLQNARAKTAAATAGPPAPIRPSRDL